MSYIIPTKIQNDLTNHLFSHLLSSELAMRTFYSSTDKKQFNLFQVIWKLTWYY